MLLLKKLLFKQFHTKIYYLFEEYSFKGNTLYSLQFISTKFVILHI